MRSAAFALALRTSDRPWALLLALLFLACVGHSIAIHRTINWDCAYYVRCGQLILDGKLPYVDFVDINPPLIMYVSVVPAFLARCLSLEPTLAFALFIDLILALSLWQLRYLLPRADPGLRPDERGLLALAWVAGGWAILLAGKWGQRDHLFALTALPYVLLRVGRYGGTRVPLALAAALGLQTAVGACLKPHFLVVLAGVELFLVLTRRTGRRLLDAENLALAIFTFAYVVHWFLLPPAMREMYFGRWVPLALKHYDLAYGVDAGTLVTKLASRAFGFGLPLVLLLASGLAVRPRADSMPLAAPLTVLAWLCLLGYLLQRKDWGYHLIPFYLTALLVTAVLVVEFKRVLESRVRPRAMGSALVVLPFCVSLLAAPIAGAFVVRETLHPATPPEEILRVGRAIDAWSRPGDPVLLVTPSIWPAYPLLLQMNRTPGSRFCLFPVAYFYPDTGGAATAPFFPYHDLAGMSQEERMILGELQEDILTRRPRLILIQNTDGGQGLPKRFHIFDYLVHVGLVDTLVPSRYREADGFRCWRLLVLNERRARR